MGTFATQADLIFYSSDIPGNHATMFGPDGKELLYREDVASFDDAGRSYTWGFARSFSIRNGQRFVFATADRETVGEVFGEEIRVADLAVQVVREEGSGKPLRVTFPGMVVVAELPTTTVLAKVPIITVVQAAAPSTSGGSLRPARPKVSVVTCTYNRPDMLRTAIESLREQTDPDWEHLIWDDGSTDPRVEGVLAWAKEDPRVRVWRGERNRDRPSIAWNFLLDRALGRYLTVLDDDNRKLPDFVAAMAGRLDQDPTLDLITCGWVVERPGRPGEPYYLNRTTAPEVLDLRSTCDGGAMLYRREALDRVGYFSEELRTNEDWDWLRRASRILRVENLDACHATYACHDTNRMARSETLGSDGDIVKLRTRVLSPTIGVRLVRPPPARLTRSQEDVCQGVERAVRAIPWVVEGSDVALVVSPFQMSDEEVRAAASGCVRVLSLHMEDPYALLANLTRVREMAFAVPEVWVAMNDVSCLPHYREVVGPRVLVCPSLGHDGGLPLPEPVERDLDVLLCGYAYPSRIRFARELLPLLGGLRVHFVGDGWAVLADGTPMVAVWSFCPTEAVPETRAWHARAKAVICLHRVHGDCSDGPVEPRTVNRGAVEGALGPRVFIDRTRDHHAFDDGDVVWYDSPQDLAGKLRGYLAEPGDSAADRHREKCRVLYSYRTRVARVLNCVRAPRFFAEVP